MSKRLTRPMRKTMENLPRTESGRLTKVSKMTIYNFIKTGYDEAALYLFPRTLKKRKKSEVEKRVKKLFDEFEPQPPHPKLSKKIFDKYSTTNKNGTRPDAKSIGYIVEVACSGEYSYAKIAKYYGLSTCSVRTYVESYGSIYKKLKALPHGIHIRKFSKRRTT